MSVEYLRNIVQNGRRIAVLLGRNPAMNSGCEFYKEEFDYDVEEKYGRSSEEIFSSNFYHNRPKEFYEFYREEILKKQGELDAADYFIKRLEDADKLEGVVTRGFFNRCKRAGVTKEIQLYGSIDANRCPRCGKIFDSHYIIDSTGIPKCDVCQIPIHPGVVLKGEMVDNYNMTRAAEIVSRADTLIILGTNMNSPLISMLRYFNGEKVALVNSVPHFADRKADCVCIGDFEEILTKVF
ncbi:MAG: Sir2 family NAD-dependent protein deacetylase [Lachnospiraceae bacterium]|nr:Sir2 family NAD-dependent protein deacetylase [Lachnospiraceae bacterium]